MAYLTTCDGARLYYEVHGEGEPLLLLNGIMMSTPSWAGFVPVLARRHRLILLDFRDQGRSSTMAGGYDLGVHVDDVRALLDALGVDRVHLLGLSYGGQVALRLALRSGDRLRSLILANVPHAVSNHLRAIGRAWEEAAALHDGERFFTLGIPFVYSAAFYESSLDVLERRQQMFKELLTPEWFEGLVRLSRSAASFRVTPDELRSIATPTLLIGADEDLIAPVRAMEALQDAIPGCELVVIHRAGHGAFLERMNEFATLVIGFATKHGGPAAGPEGLR
jgi:pimeloyl-ACP methyl ester carboxylesterase